MIKRYVEEIMSKSAPTQEDWQNYAGISGNKMFPEYT